jgi:hypothetical protein
MNTPKHEQVAINMCRSAALNDEDIGLTGLTKNVPLSQTFYCQMRHSSASLMHKTDLFLTSNQSCARTVKI